MANRKLPRLQVFCMGLTIGVVSFVLSMALIPRSVANLSDHDLQLANNLGFVFPPFVGFWAGMIRRSLLWIFLGVGVGLTTGAAYRVLSDYNFLAVMVLYPCLLGGFASAMLGLGKNSWIEGILLRFCRGLVAGFVLGFVYMVILNVLGMLLLPAFDPIVQHYRQMMWIAGTTAMGIASGLFLILFHWSANLDQVVSYRSPEPAPAD